MGRSVPLELGHLAWHLVLVLVLVAWPWLVVEPFVVLVAYLGLVAFDLVLPFGSFVVVYLRDGSFLVHLCSGCCSYLCGLLPCHLYDHLSFLDLVGMDYASGHCFA